MFLNNLARAKLEQNSIKEDLFMKKNTLILTIALFLIFTLNVTSQIKTNKD